MDSGTYSALTYDMVRFLTGPLYKEETLRRARRDTDSLKHLQLGFGETGNLPAQGPNEVSW
jgi:hypothetical protein